MQYEVKGKQVEIFFLTKEDLCSQEYIDFLNSEECAKFFHAPEGMTVYEGKKKRMDMYFSLYDLKALAVKVDGKYAGQSCGFKVYAIVRGERKELWWSCDTFLLPACRGLGIGKKLQQTLHEQLPNFSSAWYTPINGIVKRKCGAKDIANVYFDYFPVSTWLSVFCDLACLKVFKKPLPFKLRIPYLYSNLMSLFTCTRYGDYTVTEIPYEQLGAEESAFMEDALKDKDLHIERSEHFLKWRYGNLPRKYHMLKFEKDGKTEAIVAFSEIHRTRYVESYIQSVNIYDIVIAPESKLTVRSVMLYVAKWYKHRGERFDGFQSLNDCKYFGRIVWPYPSVPMLSTLTDDFCLDSYLSLGDQDMDQI